MERTVGSRAQVWHGTALKTSYGKDALMKKDLHYNAKTGRIVSKKKHFTAKREYARKLGKFPKYTKADGGPKRRSRRR
jgi:hypothetical protein